VLHIGITIVWGVDIMKILFVLDKLELKYFEFNKLVTNFWLVKGFLDRKNEVFVTTNPNLLLRGDIAYAKCYEAFKADENIFYKNVLLEQEIDSFDLVMFRPDPPVDIDYINATYIFDFVKKAEVINKPSTIRDFNEKLHSVLFKEYMSENIVTASLEDIERFLNIHKEIVLKPLNRCFGSGVMYLHQGDPNTRTIINTMTNNETTLVMVQKFIPAVKEGDKRVLTLGDKVLKYCVKKLPTGDDFKFNTHNDNFITSAELTEEEFSNFTNVARKLNSMGISMAGLDVIDGKIIEINVTSPCYFIKEINNLYNIHLEDEICDYLLTNSLLSL
jgi:glutathione synthase